MISYSLLKGITARICNAFFYFMGNIKDITGNKYGKLTVLRFFEMRERSTSIWECLCECGNITYVAKGSLGGGNTRSCGCLSTRKDMSKGTKFQDLTGLKFNRLTVIEKNGKYKNGRHLWLCKCDCGKLITISGDHIKRGHTKSCGCYNIESLKATKTTHGHTANGKPTSEYTIWNSMKGRCYNPKVKRYARYGGRGIMICNRWLNSFENFIADMGFRPSNKHSIERKNNNGNYEPSNCVWATQKEQGANTSTNRWIEYKGERKILQHWCDYFKIHESNLWAMLNKDTVDNVFDKLLMRLQTHTS